MTPPGLTCPRCKGDLYPHVASVTDDGWQHAHRCTRRCEVDGCDNKHHANGYCQPHNTRWQRWGDPLAGPGKVNHAERAEDVRWMADTGESLTGAATRLGITTDALEVWCRRHDRDSLAALLAREPKDHNRVPDGTSIYKLTGYGERRKRQPARMKRRRKVAA